MLTNLTLTNFKAWKSIFKMPLGPMTGLFGTNSSGKSSILQFLLMLKQTADSPDRQQVLQLGDGKSLVSLGTFADLLTNHDAADMQFILGWQTSDPVNVKDPDRPQSTLFTSRDLWFGAKIEANGGSKLLVRQMTYGLGQHEFTMVRKPERAQYELRVSNVGDFTFRRNPGRVWPLPAPAKFYGFPDEARAYYQNASFLSDLELGFEKMLHRTYYLGPLREYPQRDYTWPGGDPADMGRRGENAVAAILASRERGEKISRGKGKPRYTVEQYVGFWLREIGLIHDFRLEEISKGSNIYRVHVKRTVGSAEVLITDVGFGVSQILPVLVLCYYAPEGSTLLLEQPEIHLHPSVQARLADVFIDAMNVRGIQLIVESHSEHLLRRLQRRIAEREAITDDKTKLYFCDARDGTSKLTPLDIDLNGDIRNWPADFFGSEFEDTAAMLKAARERRMMEGA